MTIVVHRTSKIVRDVKPSLVIELFFPIADWIWDPSITAAAQQVDPKYWLITGDAISLMSVAQRDAVDVAELIAARDALESLIDDPETYERAFALLVLDTFNAQAQKINEILNAADTATSLAEFKTAMALIQDAPERTSAQLKIALRNKIDT